MKTIRQVVKIHSTRKEKTLNFTCAWFLELFVTSSHGALNENLSSKIS
jgi:hypothetical protein